MAIDMQLPTTVRSRWPLILLGVYCFTYFLPNISPLKTTLLIVMLATVIVRVGRQPKQTMTTLRTPALAAMLAFVCSVVYGCFISPDWAKSLIDADKPVFVDTFLVGLMLPLLLDGQQPGAVARVLIMAFCASGFALVGLDATHYYRDVYVDHAGLFRPDFSHRELSYPLLVIMPFVLAAIASMTKPAIRWSAHFLMVFLLGSMLGTLSRGAWLATAVTIIGWASLHRRWRLLATLAVMGAVVAGATFVYTPDSLLAYKIKQTDSNLRWSGGVQTAAVDLILENPIRGYGYGDEVYDEVYNRRVADHPKWIWRQSVGPHNMVLKQWFASGILGLLGILALYLGIMAQGIRSVSRLKNESREAALAVLLAFVGAVLVRGIFESGYLNFLGLIVGLSSYFWNIGSRRQETI